MILPEKEAHKSMQKWEMPREDDKNNNKPREREGSENLEKKYS